VRDQADDVRRAVRGRQRGVDVAVLVDPGVLEPELAQLGGEHPGEIELARRARAAVAAAGGLRVDAGVAQEAVEHVRGQLPREL
jgi:hypothetical protein